MSLTLLIHYRQGDNILALAKTVLSAPELKELESFITYHSPRLDSDNRPYVGETNLLKIFEKYPNLNEHIKKLLAKVNMLVSNKTPDPSEISNNIESYFPPRIQQQVLQSISGYQAAIDDYFKSDSDNPNNLSVHLTHYNKMIDKANKLTTTPIENYHAFCSKLKGIFPPTIKERIQADFKQTLEDYFNNETDHLEIFNNMLTTYRQLNEKTKTLAIAGIKTYENLITLIKNVLPRVVFDRILGNLEFYKEKIDQFFIDSNYTLTQLKMDLQPYLFLNSVQTIFPPQEFYNIALTNNDITGEFLALKNKYTENYHALINATDFNAIRAAHITLVKTYELYTLNTKITEPDNELDPQKVLQHLCVANNLLYSDESLQSALQPEFDQYRSEYTTLIERSQNRQYTLEHTQMIEKLCRLHIKFNEFLANKHNSLSNNGFYYVTAQHSPSLKHIFTDDLSSVINYSHNPSGENLASLRRARHSQPNLHQYCDMFCGPDFMRMTGIGSVVFVDQQGNIIDIKKLQEELNTSDPKELGIAVLKKMHANEPIRRLLSYIAYQGAQSKMLDLLMKNIFLCGYAMQWHPLYKQYIKIEGNNVIIENFIAYHPIQNNIDLPINTLPRVFVHCKFEIPFNDDPKVQAFNIKIATTKHPDSVYRFHVTPEFIPNNEDYDFLIKYKNEFIDYLSYKLTPYEKSGQTTLGINNLFNPDIVSLNLENIQIKNLIEQYYQSKITLSSLAYQLINIATRQLNSSSDHAQRKKYNALLKAGTGLLFDTIPDIAKLEKLIKEPGNLNSEKILEIFKIFALLSTYPNALKNVAFKNAATQLLSTFCRLIDQDKSLIQQFWNDKKTDPLLSAILCGIITLAHHQKDNDRQHSNQYKALKKISSKLLFSLLKQAERNLPDNPTRVIKGNYLQAVEVNRHASLALQNTNKKLGRYNYSAQKLNLERKFAIYHDFAKNYLKPNSPANEVHKEIVKEIISADKSNTFLSTAATTKKSKLSKSKLLNFLWVRAKNISHGILNYFDLIKVFNSQPFAQQKKSETIPVNIVLSPEHAQLVNDGKMEPIAPAALPLDSVVFPDEQKAQDAKTLTSKYIDQLKKINRNLLNSYLAVLPEKENYYTLIGQLLNDTPTDYNYDAVNNQLYTLLVQLPTKSPLKNILVDVYAPHFLSSHLNSSDSQTRNKQFDQIFNDLALLKPALSSLLNVTEITNNTVASEFLNYIFEKIKDPKTRKHFITRSFLNKLTDKELTQLAIIDKSGEVARYLLNTGFWDKLRRSHPSRKLDHVDITRIIMAHTDKDFILERAFAKKTIFGGRNFSGEFLPEDLVGIDTYYATDLRNSTSVENNSYLRSNLKRGIYMQKTWLEIIFNEPTMYIKELIKLTRLNDKYLTGLAKKYCETWKIFIPNLAVMNEPDIIRSKIIERMVSLTTTLFTNINQVNNQETLIDIFSDDMKKTFYLEHILPKLNHKILSDALTHAIQSKCVGLTNILQLFQNNNKLVQLLIPETKALFDLTINSAHLPEQATSFSRSKSPDLLDAESVRRMGTSLSSIWASTFSNETKPDKLSILQDILEDEQTRIKPTH